MNFEEIMSTYGIYAAYMGLAIVAWAIYMVFYIKHMKKTKANYLEKYPDCGKVFTTSKAFITQEAVKIYTVDGENAVAFAEKGKSGVYAKPGDIILEIEYSYTRPGVMYKTVTKSTGVVKKEVTIEPNKSYLIGYDRKAEEFTFEEM